MNYFRSWSTVPPVETNQRLRRDGRSILPLVKHGCALSELHLINQIIITQTPWSLFIKIANAIDNVPNAKEEEEERDVSN